MRLLVLSDLHIDTGQPYIPPSEGYDVVILAGDIYPCASSVVRWAQSPGTFRCAKAVFYVPGCREMEYGLTRIAQEHVRALDSDPRVRILDCEQAIFQGVRILGCTLWSDFMLPITTPAGQWSNASRAKAMANDELTVFRNAELVQTVGEAIDKTGHFISEYGALPPTRRFRAADAEALHGLHRSWLASKLAEPFSGPTIVVTHHAPCAASVVGKSRESWLSAASASDLPLNFFSMPVLWIHGSVHARCDYRIGQCRVVCNARGIAGEDGSPENHFFESGFVVEVNADDHPRRIGPFAVASKQTRVATLRRR